jgi:hypothetical protein
MRQGPLWDPHPFRAWRNVLPLSGASAHQRWLALVSAVPLDTRKIWRSVALAGARMCPFNPQALGSNPSPVLF